MSEASSARGLAWRVVGPLKMRGSLRWPVGVAGRVRGLAVACGEAANVARNDECG